MKEAFTYFTFKGRITFKSPQEYFPPTAFIHGWPYYHITEEEGTYYLYELNQDNLESQSYYLIETTTDFDSLYQTALKKGATFDRFSENEPI